MMTTKTLQTDLARKTALDDYENKIYSACRRGLEATCTIAAELHKILKEELYLDVGYETIVEYAEDRLKLDPRTYRRIIAVAQTVAQLKEAGLELPANESQAAELSRVDAAQRPGLWNKLLIQSEKDDKALTVEVVKKAVDLVENQPTNTPTKSTGGIEVEMGDDSNGSEPIAKGKPQIQEGEIRLTEKGEAALMRIRKVCGDEIADAIENGSKAMTEREIKGWADLPDADMKSLVYYLIDQRWTLNKAVNFVSKEVQPSTDVEDLLLIARARGGTAKLNVEGAKITVEIT